MSTMVKFLSLLLVMLMGTTVSAAPPTEINAKLKTSNYQVYIREGTLGDHYQLSYSPSQPWGLIKGVGVRHTQLSLRKSGAEENRFIIDSVNLLKHNSPIGDFGVSSRLEYRSFSSARNLIENTNEWRIRAILSYDTPTFTYKKLSVQGWATVSPRFSTKSNSDSRNQAGFNITHTDYPLIISPFVDTIRDEHLHHKYSLVGVYVTLPL